MVFVLDNYDSFTYNLVQYIGELGEEVVVRRNDDLAPAEIVAGCPIHTAASSQDGVVGQFEILPRRGTSQFDQTSRLGSAYPNAMSDPGKLKIVTVKRDDGDGLFVTFSDGTCAGFVAEELHDLRPNREATSDQVVPVSEV